MKNKVYTLLDLAEEFGENKQFIRRRINRLKIKAINKDSREYSNEPLKYNYSTYLFLSKELGQPDIRKKETHNDTRRNAHETRNDMQNTYQENMYKDKLIEILERELKYSKEKVEKSEEEKETLMRLLDQQQRLSLQAKQRIETLESQEISSNKKEKKESIKRKWYDIFKKKEGV